MIDSRPTGSVENYVDLCQHEASTVIAKVPRNQRPLLHEYIVDYENLSPQGWFKLRKLMSYLQDIRFYSEFETCACFSTVLVLGDLLNICKVIKLVKSH